MIGQEFSGWGRALRSRSNPVTPGDTASIAGLLGQSNSMIVHAGGRSYGDTALNGGGDVLLTSKLDRILDFDPQTGLVTVEPGVTFRQLLARFLPEGFMVPVTPGTGWATIGGAVALDVHGKNHEHAGSFCQHVVSLDLVTPDRTERTIGPDAEPALFRATCGGIGLTGIITRIVFRMARVPGPSVRVTEQRVDSLAGFLAAMDAARGASYSVGWIDCMARGAQLGRGILETAEPAADVVPWRSRKLRLPFDFPAFALNRVSIAAFNALYWRRVPRDGRVRLSAVEPFLYPLDAIGDWNRIYGRRGFHQFQAVVPFEYGEAALCALLEAASRARQASFLAVLKRMGPGRAGYLSFPMEGYTLAMDFPNKAGVAALHGELVATTRRFGGRVYLAKDALMGADDMAAMYPALADFQRVVAVVDPRRRMRSDMAGRLDV
jgi:decaprenylphospho-beta-D-ribofuranose 2-oxidase